MFTNKTLGVSYIVIMIIVNACSLHSSLLSSESTHITGIIQSGLMQRFNCYLQEIAIVEYGEEKDLNLLSVFRKQIQRLMATFKDYSNKGLLQFHALPWFH